MDDLIWGPIEGYTEYLVSDTGLVIHTRRNQICRKIKSKDGPKVNLFSKFTETKTTRAVAKLVAEAHVPKPVLPIDYPKYDTVIHLDGDRDNVWAENLLWRPRSYAIRYHLQFKPNYFPQSFFNTWERKPVVDLDGRRYLNCMEAGMTHGVLWVDVLNSIFGERPVWINKEQFFEG